jgi:hypothetical protein
MDLQAAVPTTDYTTLLIGVSGVFGTLAAALITGWYQARSTREQLRSAHESQLKILEVTKSRDEELRARQFAESDRADRLLITEYVDLILPRLVQITSIYFLAGGPANANDEERRSFESLRSWMNSDEVDPAHPEKNLKLRLTFLLFQMIAAMRLALNARWTRPLSTEQGKFLEHWEAHIEPIFCSGRYPGDELLYREQIEIIADEMLPMSGRSAGRRPMNWHDFSRSYQQGGVLRSLTDLVGRKLAFIFADHDKRNTPLRRSAQCRLAIFALYLIRMSEEAGNDSWSWRAAGIWKTVTDWYSWEDSMGQQPKWFVFEYQDVANRLAPARTALSAGSDGRTLPVPV